jgi:indolepyruvate ferredoxin oxidoreductase, alpha subunit
VLMNISVTGIHGGMVIAVADDPSQHSSQNEQDSRFYSKFAMIPCLEPYNQQDAYNAVYDAFDLSEKTSLPVMIRLTTRLAHSRSGIIPNSLKNENVLKIPENPKQFILLPAYARVYYQELLNKQPLLQKLSDDSVYNEYIDGSDNSIGIVCCGLAYNYLMENFQNEKCPYPVVKICQYPVPEKHLKRLYDECEKLLVIEDGYPLVEELLKDYFGKGKNVIGRLDGTLPRKGELNPDLIATALGITNPEFYSIPEIMINRPPVLCAGCGHHDTYVALNEVMEEYGKGKVFSDIGCYTIGALPPYDSINSCVDMGASITMAKGAADAGLSPVFAVIGDSTFTHSGLTGLLDCVNEKTNVNILIVDNSAIAMTGGQDSSATGRIEKICEGIGVDPEHLKIFVPLKKNHSEMVEIMKQEISYAGVSVLIARRECVQKLSRVLRSSKK